ncbi:hypothetical protein [Enterococcus faecalis]|uniref:hypothetical protein n=1 Tax=Enterococcus faecalis TaxID=1351 RepID=UPI0040438720
MRNDDADKKKENTYDLLLKLTKKNGPGFMIYAGSDEEIHSLLFSWIDVAEGLKKENRKLRKIHLQNKKTYKERIEKLERECNEEKERADRLENELERVKGKLKKRSEEEIAFYNRALDLEDQLNRKKKILDLKEYDSDQKIANSAQVYNKKISNLKSEILVQKKKIRELETIKPFFHQKKRTGEGLNPEDKKNTLDSKRRGGCQLTDKQIERLLLIYKEKERVPITEAISKLAITRRTYYRVINLNYKYEETRDRIRKIAFDLGVVLPEKGK